MKEMITTILVAYFSATGTTEQVATHLAQVADADLFEIVAAEPYTAADLDWTDKRSRSSLEMSDPQSRPAVASHVENMAQYDTILLGFPIWWYTAPTIVRTFLEQYDLEGKTIILFATSGGSPLGKSGHDLAASAPGATIQDGRVFKGTVSEAELRQWLESLRQ